MIPSPVPINTLKVHQWLALHRTTGSLLSAAKRSTALRKAIPIFSKIAGDGIGLPRCAVINDTTCPATCRFGT